MTDQAVKKRRFVETIPDVPSGNPKTFCRLCFSTASIKRIVLGTTDEYQPLVDSIRLNAGIELVPPEDFPFALCYGCVETLRSVDQFRQRCFDHDQALRLHRLRGPPPIVRLEEDLQVVEPESLLADGNEEAVPSVPVNGGDQASGSTLVRLLEEYRCYACDKAMHNSRDYNWHMRKVHAKLGGFVSCNMCSKKFRLFTKFQLHMKEHAIDKRRRIFTCEQWKQSARCCRVCFKKFTHPKELVEHQRMIHGFKFACEWCLQRFQTEKDRIIHELLIKASAMDSETMVTCAICKQELPNKYALRNHMEMQHEPLFACGSCIAQFSTILDYIQHQRVDHQFRPAKDECLSCRETFPCWDEYVHHLNIQHTVYSDDATILNGETKKTNQPLPTLQIDLDSSEDEKEEAEPEPQLEKPEEAMTVSSDDFPIYGNEEDDFNGDDEFGGADAGDGGEELETELVVLEEADPAVTRFDLYGSAFHNLQ